MGTLQAESPVCGLKVSRSVLTSHSRGLSGLELQMLPRTTSMGGSSACSPRARTDCRGNTTCPAQAYVLQHAGDTCSHR